MYWTWPEGLDLRGLKPLERGAASTSTHTHTYTLTHTHIHNPENLKIIYIHSFVGGSSCPGTHRGLWLQLAGVGWLSSRTVWVLGWWESPLPTELPFWPRLFVLTQLTWCGERAEESPCSGELTQRRAARQPSQGVCVVGDLVLCFCRVCTLSLSFLYHLLRMYIT